MTVKERQAISRLYWPGFLVIGDGDSVACRHAEIRTGQEVDEIFEGNLHWRQEDDWDPTFFGGRYPGSCWWLEPTR